MGLFRLHSLLKCLLLVTMARGHQHVAWDAHRYRQATTSDLVGHSESFVQLPSLGARRSVQGWQAPLEARVAQLFLEKESYTRASFPAECSKHFRRLYYNTRDCMTPACAPVGFSLVASGNSLPTACLLLLSLLAVLQRSL